MGFLRHIINRWFGSPPKVRELPSGSVTVDQAGAIITSTVSSAFPAATLQQVGREVMALFQEARAARLPLAELSVQFGSLLITARELRGGAVIFLFPQTATLPGPNESRL